jgi:hypothetical protein
VLAGAFDALDPKPKKLGVVEGLLSIDESESVAASLGPSSVNHVLAKAGSSGL